MGHDCRNSVIGKYKKKRSPRRDGHLGPLRRGDPTFWPIGRSLASGSSGEACPGRGLAGQAKRSAPSSGGAGLPARQICDVCRTSVSRQCDRVAKVMDSKSIGLCPQGFKSPRCRRSSPCLRRALLVRRHRRRAARDLSRPLHKQARYGAGARRSKRKADQVAVGL